MLGLKPVTVGRYDVEGQSGPWNADGTDGGAVLGCVETADWIVWEFADGSLQVFNGRSDTGAVHGRSVILYRQAATAPTKPIHVNRDGVVVTGPDVAGVPLP